MDFSADSRLIRQLLCLICLGCGAGFQTSTENQRLDSVARYRVSFDGGSENADVEVCFEGAVPPRLQRVGEGAERILQDVRGERGPLRRERTAIYLEDVREGECIHYSVSLASGGRREAMIRSGGEAVITLGLLLWAPTDGTPMTMSFVAAGRHVSVPWDGEEVPPSVRHFAGNVVITRAPPRTMELDGLRLKVAQLDGPLMVDAAAVDRWLRSAVEAVRPMGGSFPREALHLVVVPAGAADSAILFGLVRRGGGASILLFPTANANEEELTRAWVLVHELSHLTMPRLSGDRWISEGYATYMQEFLRLRAGLLTPEVVWRRIATKLRAERVGAGLPLTAESDIMSRTRTYSHVYWAGAALFLEIDIALRRRGSSLFEVIGSAPWSEGERWDGYRCLAAIDEISGAAIAMPLAERYAGLVEIPDLTPLLEELGVLMDEDGVHFDDEAPGAALRQGMNAPSGEASR
ncbi:MAG: hypothetical protein ACI9KE_001581 [Polyangiales bacterium]|jgi:hypothetical protein